MKVDVSKPGTPLEILEHHGVKGQKWGRRKATRAFTRKNPTSVDRRDAILRARVSDHKAFSKSVLESSPKKRADLRKAYLNNPDRATALRMTKGEKVVTGLVAGVFAVPSAGLVPALVGASVGIRVAQRHHIEKKQARGGFK